MSLGVKKILSISGARLLFMVASWNSYSKSATALKPLIIAIALLSLAKSTVSFFEYPKTSILGLSLKISEISSILSSTLNKGFLDWLSATPRMTLSNNAAALSTISICPK